MKTNYSTSRMLTTFRFAVLFIFLLASTTSWAQVIAAWQFGTPASTGIEEFKVATTYDPHIEQPILSRGNGIEAYTLGRGFSSINWLLSGTENFNSALNEDNYYEFTIKSEPHYQVSISSIKARLRRSANGPTKYQWAYNVNNAGFVAIGSAKTLADAVDAGELVASIDLSTISALQGKFLDKISLVFRLCAWNATEDTGSFAFGRTPEGTTTNSLEITGTVIPVNAPAIASTISASTNNYDASNIQSTSAIVYGQITDLGYPKAMHHGFCWSTNPIPENAPLPTNKVDFGEPYSLNEYMATLENLTPNTTYYYCSYAINSSGIKYGQNLSFKTAAAVTPKDIAINFTGSGSASTVGSVTVENLTTGETKSISGDAVLYLNPTAKVPTIPTMLESAQVNEALKMTVYPNPATASSTLSFGLAEKGNVLVNICDISGKVISNYSDYLTEGTYKFQLPAMQSGIYFVTLVQNGNKQTQKLVSINNNVVNLSPIQNIEKTELVATVSDNPQKVSAATAANEGMVFNVGNQLRFTATSGRNKTIIMDSPTKSKTIDVMFKECIDGDDNAYAIIKIGTLYWMAENLKTTRKANGTPLTKVTGAAWSGLSNTSEAYCYYNDDDANAAKFGALYTHNAAKTDLAPLGGWRLPTQKEFKQLAGYLDGKERAGAKLKEIGNTNWTDDNKYATNESGFKALPAGMKTGSTFSPTGEFAAYWTSSPTTTFSATTNTYTPSSTEVYFAKLLSGLDSISLYNAMVKAAGLSVRYVFEVPDTKPEQMQNEFGGDPTSSTDYNNKLPLPKNTVLMATDKELFFTGRHNTSLSPQLRFMDNPAATSAPFIASLPAIATGGVKWWENPKKVTTMVNENGRESTVIAVWNEAEAGAISGYKNITLHIIGDESVNYAHQAVVLPDKFWMPTIVSGTAYTGKELNEFEIQKCWQWEMTLRTGDVTGDGIPEILVAVHDTLRIYEYDGTSISRKYQRGFYSDFNQSKNFAFYLRVEVADMDQDGKNDVVVMTSTPKSFEQSGTDDSKCARMHLFLKGNIENNDAAVYKNKALGNSFSTNGEVAYGDSKSYVRLANFTIGDVNNDGHPEIVIFFAFNNFTTFSVTSANNATVRGLTYCTLNLNTTNDKLFVFAPIACGGYYHDWSTIQAVVLAKLKGPSGPNYIINGDAISYVYTSGLLDFKREPLNGNFKDYGYIAKEYGYLHVVFGDQIVVGNFDKDPSGREMLYYIANLKSTSVSVSVADLKIYSSALNQTTDEVILNTNPVPFFNENSGYLLNKNHFPVIAAVNTRHTGRLLQFQRHEYMLTKPKLIAAIAAAPYLAGAYNTNSVPSTSWSTSTMSGTAKDTTLTHTATAIVGYEHEFEVPVIGTKIGGIEFTAKAALGFSKNYASTESTKTSITYTSVDEDMAVVTSTPYDAFYYKILKSERSEEVNTEVMFGFPRTMVTQFMPVDIYNKLIEGENAPRIDKSIFRHTPGDPFSYPNGSTTRLSNLPSSISNECGSDFKEVSRGGSISVSIGKETTNTKTTGFSQDYEFELVGTVGGFKLGGGYGFNKEKTESTTVGNGTEVQGTVPGLQDYYYYNNKYDWAMKWYNYQKSGFKFQVINYLVTKK